MHTAVMKIAGAALPREEAGGSRKVFSVKKGLIAPFIQPKALQKRTATSSLLPSTGKYKKQQNA